MEPPRFRIAEAAKVLGIRRSRIYERIREGRIAVLKDGRDSFITRDELLRYATQPQPGVERYKAGDRA